MKSKIQKRTPTTCKDSTKNGLKQVLGQVSRLIRAKCKDWQVKLEGMYQTDTGLVVTASPRSHTASCPCCGRKSHSVHCCHRLVRRIGMHNPRARSSGYVGIDDFAKKKGHVYACTIVDHYTRDTLAVFDSRYGEEIREWLAEHTEIKLVARDGSQSYADIITVASPDIVQVSDRFHLIKNLRETAVDLVRDLLGKKKQKVEYPYPTEEEAYGLIFDDMLGMGEERHRTKVREYYRIRRLKDEGKSIAEISSQLGFTSRKVYKRLHTDISKVLSGDQMKVLSAARRMAHIIALRTITPEVVCKHLDGALSSALVNRCMRSVTKKYGELRKSIRNCNENQKAGSIKH